MKQSIVAIIGFVGFSGLLLTPRSAAAAAGPLGDEGSAELTAERDAASRLLAAADTDADQHVTLRELGSVVSRTVQRRVVARFKQLDRDHDGFVTRAEVPKMPGARFVRFDLSGDGRFTRAELAAVLTREASARLAQRFAELDANGDARCTLAELAAGRGAPVDHRAVPPAQSGDRTARRAATR